jgi:hypothetical protein
MSTTPSTPPPGTTPGTYGFGSDDDTSPSGVADKAQGAKHAAQETASTAADETKHVAGVAGEEVKKVAGEAKEHARNLLDEARGQVDEQSRTQRDRLVGTLSSFSSDLQQMVDRSDTSGLAAELARQVADRARTLGDHLDGREPADLIEDVRSFARRRPGVFLVGALAAGVVAGRLARGAKAAQQDGSPSGEVPLATPTPPPPAMPVVPAPPPPVPGAGIETVGQPQSTAPVSSDPLTAPELAEARNAGDPGQSSPGYTP